MRSIIATASSRLRLKTPTVGKPEVPRFHQLTFQTRLPLLLILNQLIAVLIGRLLDNTRSFKKSKYGNGNPYLLFAFYEAELLGFT